MAASYQQSDHGQAGRQSVAGRLSTVIVGSLSKWIEGLANKHLKKTSSGGGGDRKKKKQRARKSKEVVSVDRSSLKDLVSDDNRIEYKDIITTLFPSVCHKVLEGSHTNFACGRIGQSDEGND
eukprot:scaffold9008_cov56-Cyclotella_meneghiniana.AAC.5